MDSEQAINAADYLLREVPHAKIGNNAPVVKRGPVKEELQFLRLSDNIQVEIMDTLKFIHGPEFKLGTIDDYADVSSNIDKKYWVGRGNLVIKGSCDYSQYKDTPMDDVERIKQFALLRLESYGFHQNHCIEALEYCNANIDDSLLLLYSKYFEMPEVSDLYDNSITEEMLLEHKDDERSSIESIYDKIFTAKQSNVYILNLKLDYLLNIFHKKPTKRVENNVKKKPSCRNFLVGNCKFGNKCRFSHDIEKPPPNPNAHLDNYFFELELRFPLNSKYPYEPPLIFFKTDAVLPPLVNLHICKRLYEEAKQLSLDGMPCVYTITQLLLDEDAMRAHLKTEVNFIPPHQKLFSEIADKSLLKQRPSHYKKGKTNRNNKRAFNEGDLIREDKRIVDQFFLKQEDSKYLKMMDVRRNLPAWNLKKDILNSIEKYQIIVVSGETGCGKSTQVPQFILDEWMSNYSKDNKHVEIVCTQPRRISAIGVAERVADERVDKIGGTVGYQIRLENKISSSTRLTFCTTGILLRRLEGEPTLPTVTHIIVDEVHERSEESDFLLLILKELVQIRRDLKVILMSATLNASLFSDYFKDIPVLDIPGRTFPVQQYFLEDILEVTNYVLEEGSEYSRKIKFDSEELDAMMASSEINFANAKPKDAVKDEGLSIAQTMARYQGYSVRTCKNLFMMDIERINNELIENILTWIISDEHDYPKTGTILIFLPGIAEITSLYEQLAETREFGRRTGRFILLPLHSSLTSEEQAAIFRKPPYGVRKIVLSTNLAETSVTIDDCVFVIDAGKMKEKHFDPNRNMESLETVWVTRANALQRKGRAGRVMSGVCFHLYTSHRFKHHMLPQPIPEIHRIPLEQMILNIKVLPNFNERQVEDVLNSFIEPPVAENVSTAIHRLQNVGALDKVNCLTALGHHLAALPVDVRIGKLMLYGAIFGCVDSALTMAACLSFKNPFVSPFGKRDEANHKKKQFAAGFSDQITVLFAYKKWLSVYKKSFNAGRNFANENYLSLKTLVTIADIKHQFLEFLVDIGFISVNLTGRKRTGQDNVLDITGTEFNRNGENLRLLSSILCASLYPNLIKILTPSKSYIMSAAGALPKENNPKDLRFSTVQETVFMHPSSVNYTVTSFPSPYLVYQEKVRTSKVYFRDCTMVPLHALVLFSGYDVNISVQNGCTFVSLEEGWILFQVEEHKIAEMIKMIRQELDGLLEEKINDPLLNLAHHEKGDRVIELMLKIIGS